MKRFQQDVAAEEKRQRELLERQQCVNVRLISDEFLEHTCKAEGLGAWEDKNSGIPSERLKKESTILDLKV